MDFKFVHAADLHLDSPLRNVVAKGPVQQLLHGATFEALKRIVDLCLQERVEFLLLAGDLYDAKDRSVRARLALRDQLSRLHAAGISTFIVHGNHDPLVSGAGAVQLPPSVRVFGPTWEEHCLLRAERVLCRIQGVSYGQERVTENLSQQFARKGPEFTVGLLHANVGASTAHAAYAPCSFEDLDGCDLNYWALGHVHTRAEQRLPGGGVAVYPGNPQGRHINEAGPRGCYVVDVRGQGCTQRFVPVDSVRWHALCVPVEALTTVDELVDLVEASLPATEAGQHAHVVRVRLVGRGPLHRELQVPEALAQLREHLGDALERRGTPVVLEGLHDESGPSLDFERISLAGGLAAEVLAVARASAASPPVWAAEALQGMDRALAAAGLPKLLKEFPALLDQATARALDLLQETP